ncbi:MAG: hypothetical protein ACOYZ7_06905 [Chloroflexota bacterium]
MRREIVLVWLVLAAGLIVVGYSTLERITMPVDGQPTHPEPVGQLMGSETVGQTFLSRYDGLNRIDVFLGAYARPNTQDVIFYLKTAPDAPADILTVAVNASAVQDYAYHAFTFPPIPDSAGQSYFFYLTSPSSESGDAITTWKQTTDLYPEGHMVQNGLIQVGDLDFQVHYQPTVLNRLVALLDRLAQDKPSIWGDKRLYVVLLGWVIGSAIWLLTRTAQEFLEDELP